MQRPENKLQLQRVVSATRNPSQSRAGLLPCVLLEVSEFLSLSALEAYWRKKIYISARGSSAERKNLFPFPTYSCHPLFIPDRE